MRAPGDCAQYPGTVSAFRGVSHIRCRADWWDDRTRTAPALRLGTTAGRGTLLAAILASGMVFLDSTVVNVALPHLGQELGATVAGLQWTVNGYLLMLAAFVLLGGALGDRFGRRRIFLIGVVWFTLASVLCGLAQGTGTLIAARFLQGAGGALLTPGSLSVLQASFHPDDRGRAIGAWAGLSGVSTALGPVHRRLADRRALLAVDLLPQHAARACWCVLAAARWVPESRDENASRTGGPDATPLRRRRGAARRARAGRRHVRPDRRARTRASTRSPVLIAALVGVLGRGGLRAAGTAARRRRDAAHRLFGSRLFSRAEHLHRRGLRGARRVHLLLRRLPAERGRVVGLRNGMRCCR